MVLSQKFKKIVAIVSISCVSVAAVIGLSLLFNIFGIRDNAKLMSFIGSVMLTILSLFVGSLFSLNSIDAINRKNILGYISAGLIIVSTLLVIITVWGNFGNPSSAFWGVFGKISCVFAACSIFLSVLIANLIKHGLNLLPIQIICYVTLAVIESDLVMLIITSKLVIGTLWLIASAIVCFVMSIVLSIKGKMSKDTQTITISVDEYNKLKERIVQLEKELNEAKNVRPL